MNISKVLHKNLKLTKDDAVVVLMDIEHAEWEVLPGAFGPHGSELPALCQQSEVS